MTQNDAEQTFTLDLPGRADVSARNLRIEASPSIAGALFGALDYLTSFPYGCTEQTMSSFLPNVIVAQTLKDMPHGEDSRLERSEQESAERSGSTLRVSARRRRLGLVERRQDRSVHDCLRRRWTDDGQSRRLSGRRLAARSGRQKLSSLLSAGKNDNGNPIDDETRAYMIYAFTESGDGDAHFLEELYGKRNNLGPYGRALLALALQERKDGRAAKSPA